MKKVVLPLIALLTFVSFSCSNQMKNTSNEPVVSTGVGSSGPDAIIYKTKDNYNLLVPIIMNPEKNEIVSYPAPGDLKYKGEIATPTLLEEGFLLDNRGITENVAFLNITYKEYMELKKTPTKEELLEMILEKNPLTVMYNCGKRATYKDEVNDLNTIILSGDLGQFKKIK